MMTASSVLEEPASEQIKNIYLRRQPSQVLGVKFGDMGNIIRRLGRDSSLPPCA
jgi:hypothetical protein